MALRLPKIGASVPGEATSMLRSAKSLVGFTIGASDGDMGRVETLYFDDQQWTVRYFVVDTSGWLTSDRILVSPVCVRRPEWQTRRLAVALTKTQVQASPSVDTHRPISRQYEIAFAQYYGIPSYWPTSSVDQHLRSTEDVRGYSLHATDGAVGHVEDFLVEDLTWRLRYMAVDTRNWWPGTRVLVAPEWIEPMSWEDSAVVVALPRDVIKNAPEYDPSRPLERAYEQRLYDFYGRWGYWEERAAA
jgi:hypothetical protein